jgi:hypothetical protein
MKHKTTRAERKNYLAYALDKLDDKGQAYLETLTAQLSEIHQTALEKQVLTGIKPKNRVQQNIREDK